MRTLMGVGVIMAAIAALPFIATPSQAQGGGWSTIGCRVVNFAIDRDVIRPARRDGRYRAIRLRARGNNIYMLDVKVVYGNGEPDDIQVRAEIRAGASTAAKDLRGFERFIDRVEMIYRTQPNFRGRGEICVDGR